MSPGRYEGENPKRVEIRQAKTKGEMFADKSQKSTSGG
jgi:hypothetical protein